MFFSIFSFLFFLIETSLASCKFKFIHNASEFIEFSNETYYGISYSEYTVYLVNDIDFSSLSQQFIPAYLFQGTFDGQGHVVRNLVANSLSFYLFGLFGNSDGTTIRNVVVDSSCSFSSSYVSSSYGGYVAGIMGGCNPVNRPCVIENSVNMANLKFTGRVYIHVYM